MMVWIACAAAAALGRGPWWIIELMFLLAPLVVVPLALVSLGPANGGRMVRVLQPLGAAATVASFLLPRGALAGALAAAWLIVTLRLAADGLTHLWTHRFRSAAETSIAAGPL